MKPGRPTRFTQDLAIELICLVDDGMTRKAAAARMARRDRNGGGPKALEAVTRRLLATTLRWR
jgi:hypothetical protein